MTAVRRRHFCTDLSEIRDQGLGLARRNACQVEETEHKQLWSRKYVFHIFETNSARTLCE